MGATNVGEVLAWWTHLPDSPFRALLRMAHTSLDNPSGDTPAKLYFGGHKLIADTLRAGSRGGSADTRMRQARRAVQDLIEAGAIRRVSEEWDRGTETYELTLNVKPVAVMRKRRNKPRPSPEPNIIDSVAEGSCTPGGEGYGTPPPRGTGPLVNEGSCTPTEEALRGTTDELRDDQGVSVITLPTVAREAEPRKPEPDPSLPPCGDPTCFLGYVKIPGQKGNQRCPVCNPARTKPAWSS